MRAAFFGCLVAAAACGGGHDEAAPPRASGQSEWTLGAPLPVARFEAYAAVQRRKILFIGGITGVFGDIATAEPSRRVDVLDPSARTWSAGPELPADAPKHHLTVATWDDRIYVLGGFDGILAQHPGEPFRPVATAYVLDGAAWRKIASPPLARGAATAQAIAGKIYVTGGAPNEGEPSFTALDVYDIATDRWSQGAPLPTAREHLASCALGGKMIVVGGWIAAPVHDAAQNAAESYDPALDRWTSLPPLPTARGGLAAIAQDGVCHVVGGEDWALPFPGTFGAHEIFDPARGAWSTGRAMPTARHGFGLASLAGALYAIGGGPSQGNSYTDVVEIQSP